MALYDPGQEPEVLVKSRWPAQPDMLKASALNRITVAQATNLWTLACYLRSLPENYEKFNMNLYLAHQTDGWVHGRPETVQPRDHHKLNECGTTACAVGHGPAAGLAPVEGEDWGEYRARLFGTGFCDHVYDRCFSGQWEGHDNSVLGAAARIHQLLAEGDNAYPHQFSQNYGAYL